MADISEFDVHLNYVTHHNVLQRSVFELACQEKFLDVCFVCNGGVKVQCHKLVICTVSPTLKEIFMSVPYCEEKIITVYVPDVEARILQMVLDFVYKGCITVNNAQRKKMAETTKLLGIFLLQNTEEPGSAPPPAQQLQLAPQQAQPSPQQVQPSPLYYMPTSSNTQGQMQYMVPQGQMMSTVQQGISQQASGQLTLMAQPPGQMVQQVQPGTALQQNSMMQVVQQNTQVAPRSSHLVATNQIVSGPQMVNGPQMVQCSNEMVVQGSQPMMMNSSQMEVGLQNQMSSRSRVSSTLENSVAFGSDRLKSPYLLRRNTQRTTKVLRANLVPVKGVPWTCKEKELVFAHFSSHITQKITPRKEECVQCKEKNPAVLERRSWRDLKYFVCNYNKLKRGQPRYVMSSNSNDLTTTRAARQYSQVRGQQTRTVNRTQQRHQQIQQTQSRMNNGISSEKLKEEITALLNSLDITKTTIRTLQSVLEHTLRCDLSERMDEVRTAVKDWLDQKEALKKSEQKGNPDEDETNCIMEKENELEDNSENADGNGMDISLEQMEEKKKRGRPKSYTLSEELAKLVGKPSMTYSGVFQKIKSLVEERSLYCNGNKNYAICDNEMLKVFGVKRFLIKSLMKHLKGHLFCKKFNYY